MSQSIKTLPFPLNGKELLDVISGETISVCRQVEPQTIVVEMEDDYYVRNSDGSLLLPSDVGYMGLFPGDKINFNCTIFEIGNILILPQTMESMHNVWYWNVQICPIQE